MITLFAAKKKNRLILFLQLHPVSAFITASLLALDTFLMVRYRAIKKVSICANWVVYCEQSIYTDLAQRLVTWRGKETRFISIRPISECARR
jgi:hypothetical protein